MPPDYYGSHPAARDFGLVASRITKLLIQVAEANGAPQELMRSPVGLISKPDEVLRGDGIVPWRDLVVLADRVAHRFGDGEPLVEIGRSYYQHLGDFPYARLASSVLTLRGAFFISNRYTAPHNYEALDCAVRWLNPREAIKTNRLKYAADPVSTPIMHITKGVLEYFPTLFGRDPLPFLEMEMGAREVRYHLRLPPPIHPWKFLKRTFHAAVPNRQRWQILRDQETRLTRTQWESSRRQRILDDLLSKATEPLVLMEDGRAVFINEAVGKLVGNAEGARSLPFQEIASRLGGTAGEARCKFVGKSADGSVLPLEAILSARLGAENLGTQTLLLRLRDRREPETREQAISLARDEERQSLARDLHDGLGQTLSGLTYRIAALRHARPDDAALAAIESGIRSALAAARHLAHGNADIPDMKPIERLRLTCASYAALADIPVDFSVDGETAALAAIEIRELDLILRETLANAVRHSGASVITVSVAVTLSAVVLDVADNGRGLPTEHLPGFGIASMKSRALALGGSVEWTSVLGGTRVCCVIPILNK